MWPIYVILGITLLIVIIGFTFIFLKLKQKDQTLSGDDMYKLGALERQIEQLQENINNTLKLSGEITKKELIENQSQLRIGVIKDVTDVMTEGFKNTQNTVSKFFESLIRIETTQEKLDTLSSNVESLKTVLQGNTSRGKYGEMTLKAIIESVFGYDVVDVYEYQKEITNKRGEKVKPDVVIFVPPPDNLICIDSKFPYVHYEELIEEKNQSSIKGKEKIFIDAVKKHIKDIKDRYIVSGITAAQAFMYIPSDAIFLYLHSKHSDLIENAYRDNVIMVSPSTLQPILSTTRMLKLDYKRAMNIADLNKRIEALDVQFVKLTESWEKFSRSIKTTNNAIDEINTRFRALFGLFKRIKTSQEDLENNDVSIDEENEESII